MTTRDCCEGVGLALVPTLVAAMRGAGLLQRVRDFVELGKPRLSSLVVASTGAGFLMAGAVDYGLLAATCVGTALCATSANTFNQVTHALTLCLGVVTSFTVACASILRALSYATVRRGTAVVVRALLLSPFQKLACYLLG